MEFSKNLAKCRCLRGRQRQTVKEIKIELDKTMSQGGAQTKPINPMLQMVHGLKEPGLPMGLGNQIKPRFRGASFNQSIKAALSEKKDLQ